MRRKPRSGSKPQTGTATIELALLAPLFILLGLGVADLGRAMYASMVVDNAARAGAQFALDYRYTDAAGIQAAAVQDTQTSTGTSLLNPAFTTTNVTVTTSCPCPGGTIPGTQACSPVPACGGGNKPMAYVTVQTSYTFTYKYIAKLQKWSPATVTLKGKSVVRVQ